MRKQGGVDDEERGFGGCERMGDISTAADTGSLGRAGEAVGGVRM